MKKKRLRNLIISIVLMLLSAFGLYMSRIPGFADLYSRTVYRTLSGSAAVIWGMLPFSLTEFLVYAAAGYALLGFLWSIFCVFRPIAAGRGGAHGTLQNLSAPRFVPLRNYLSRLLLILSTAAFLYVYLCGINYRRDSFCTENGIEITAHSTDELTALCRYLVTRIQETETAAEGNAFGADAPAPGQSEDSPKTSFHMLQRIGKTAKAAMEGLGREYSGLSGSYPLPKYLFNARILSVQQLTGVYSPFTIEANYNREIPWYDLPFTMCHELSHLRGYMQEEEANFLAFLGCIGSEDSYFQYAGWLSAWVYCGNALAKSDPKTFSELYGELPEKARADLQYNNRFWEQFESPVAETAEKVNDSYLKANGQTAGVVSYDRVTELILEYFCTGKLH